MLIRWPRLVGIRLSSSRFDRLLRNPQHPIGIYTADFYCADERLVIEIDCRTGYLGKSYVMRVAGFVRNRMRYRRLGGSSGFLQTQLHKPLTATVQRVDTDPVPHGDSIAKQYLQEAVRLRTGHGFDLAYPGTEDECSCPCAHHHDRWWSIERQDKVDQYRFVASSHAERCTGRSVPH